MWKSCSNNYQPLVTYLDVKRIAQIMAWEKTEILTTRKKQTSQLCNLRRFRAQLILYAFVAISGLGRRCSSSTTVNI